MSAKYQELDAAIIDHISVGCPSHPTYAKSVIHAARRALGHKNPYYNRRYEDAEWRLIDRRMQALRKAGRIRYLRETGLNPRWVVCDVASAPDGCMPNSGASQNG